MATGVKYPFIQWHNLESICGVIADTTEGLTGAEIGTILANCGIDDIDTVSSKRKRLYHAFANYQKQSQCSNKVLNFLTAAMQPSRYLGKDVLFHYRLNELNKSLSFIGLELTEQAKFKRIDKASTLTEAQQRASHYKHKLEMRNTHLSVMKYCKDEILDENYFHSVFEAVKSVADRIRSITGLYTDGVTLTEVAFSTSNPLIKINLLQNDTQRSEHLGLTNLIKGMFGLIRNPTAHTPKIKFIIEEDEALDIMCIVSLIHKKLDKMI